MPLKSWSEMAHGATSDHKTNYPALPRKITFSPMSAEESLRRQNELKLPPQVVAMRSEKFLARLSKHPLLHQYAQHVKVAQAHNNEPWHAIGERLHAAVLVGSSCEDLSIGVMGLKADAASWRAQLMLEVAEWIAQATPYLWTDEIERLADAAPLPKHVVSPSVLPAPLMFWSRETAYVDASGLIENNWIALAHGGDNCIEVVGDSCEVAERNGPLQRFRVALSRIDYGATWPQDFATLPDAQRLTVEKILKRCAFLASPYVLPEPARLKRHTRRQLERAGVAREDIEEPIHVVKLRHAVKPPAKPSTEHGDGVEWKHHWWVQGFYRAQWYPSEQAHKVIWIAPHLKGDRSKPLLEKVYAVVR